ncbi:hypothetical protein MTP99_004290 [Tenebrio molitor]|nr:hypothetical protein MTP99_004290 [Tenebrio molitor]
MASTNQPGQGVNYEVVVSALFSLRLCMDDKIADFKLETNETPEKTENSEQNFKFDDIIIEITPKTGDKYYFAIQLKHAEKAEKNLQPTGFTSGKEAKNPKEQTGNFVMNMYCKSSFCNSVIDCERAKCQTVNCREIHCSVPYCKLAHRKIIEIERKPSTFYYILYSNRGFDPEKMDKVKDFKMEKFSQCKGIHILSTNPDEIYKFKTKVETPETENVKKGDYEEFFKRFSLYLGQKNAQGVEKEIEKEFEEKFGSSRWAANYIEFFKHCHDGLYRDRKVDKETVRIQLIDLLLPMERMSFRSDACLTDFQEMTKTVKLTVVNLDATSCEDYFIQPPIDVSPPSRTEVLRSAKNAKIVKKSEEEISSQAEIKTFFYCFERPIVVKYVKTKSVDEAIKLCVRAHQIHLVVLGDVDASEFTQEKVFQNLKDIYDTDQNLGGQVFDGLTVTLRTNKSIALKSLVESANVSPFVTSANILQMLNGKYHIGEASLPDDVYVPRQVEQADLNVQDAEIFEHFAAGNYLVCGESGSGKTELLKFLCRNCPLDDLTVFVSFKHNKIFLQEHTVDGYLDKFLDIATEQPSLRAKLRRACKEKKARFVSMVQEAGFRFWVASRTSTRPDLEQALNVTVLNIKTLQAEDQRNYVREKMKGLYSPEVIQSTVEEIDAIRSKRSEHQQLLELPLNLNMLIKICNESDGRLLGDNLVVTDLYRALVEGNFSHYLKKQEIIPSESPILDFLKFCNAATVRKGRHQVLSFRTDGKENWGECCYEAFVDYVGAHNDDPLGIIRKSKGRLFGVLSWTCYWPTAIRSSSRCCTRGGGMIGTEEGIMEPDEGERSALHLACSQTGTDPDWEQVVRTVPSLHRAPTILHSTDALYNMTPADYCGRLNNVLRAVILRRTGFDLEPDTICKIFDHALAHSDVALFEEVLTEHCTAEYLASHTEALMTAIERRYSRLVELFLEESGRSRRGHLFGESAAVRCHQEPVRRRRCLALVNRQVGTDFFGDGFTPLRVVELTWMNFPFNEFNLYVAVLHHQIDAVRLLLTEFGAGVDLECSSADLPVDDIANEIVPPMWEVVASEEKRSALDLAVDCGYDDVVAFLLERGATSVKYNSCDDYVGLAVENKRILIEVIGSN